MPAFTYEIDHNGIAILTFDLPGEKINKLTTPVMSELDTLLDELAANTAIKALVFRSGKPESFIVGADIAEIRGLTSAETGEQLARKGQAVFAKLEALPFPTVAAIHGPCMGGGLELALACSNRVISNDPRTVLALPEVKLGIIPGFGGTQLLPRLVGLSNSLDMILTGRSIYPKKAKKIGLADEVTYRETLLQVALDTVRAAAGKARSARIRGKRPLAIRLLESNPFTRALIYRAAKKSVLKETRGNYPAPLAALDAVRYGLSHRQKTGYATEARSLGELASTAVSKNLISVFYLNESIKKDPHPSTMRVASTGVLGAGVMGGGISQLFAEKGFTVRMKDITSRAVGAGLREAAAIFGRRQAKGILVPLQSRDGFDRITGTTDYSGFGLVDVAVEAVIENMDIKKSVLMNFEAVARTDAIFASNTSSLSISELATAARHPGRVIGMHFFNPVDKMPLVEVIRGKQTSEETVSAIATLARKLGKLPVIVNDGPGFLVNRILMPYLNEAAALLEQGSKIDKIDQALLRFGMPMGAFILLDEIGIDIAHKVAEILHQGLGERAKPSPLLGILYKDGYFGRKNGKGFYQYEHRNRKGPYAAIHRRLSAGTGKTGTVSPEEIVDRTMLLMIKEAALCLEENIIDRPDLLDAALIFGIGFPPFRGGLLRYADTIGARVIVQKLETCAKTLGTRFAPPASLLEMARSGKTFYP